MNGISALIKETPQRPLTLSATQGNSENTQSMNQECFQDGAVLKNLPAGQELQEIWVRALGQEDPLEEEMATHSSILAWKTPWTEEPGRLQSTGSQKRHNQATEDTEHIYL